MNTRYETDRDLQDLHEPAEQDREISLGTTTILGIFFALALLCAVFFGFGYSMGRRSALPVAGSAETTTGSEGNISKPAPGSPVGQVTPAGKQSAGATQSAVIPIDSSNADVPDTPQVPGPTPVKALLSSPRSESHVDPSANKAAKPITIAASSPTASVVQVAAMSHQEDADVVAVDLKRRGYTVAIRREPQDKLFHVQIGPFTNRKDADAMRQHLQTDGYNNSIVK